MDLHAVETRGDRIAGRQCVFVQQAPDVVGCHGPRLRIGLLAVVVCVGVARCGGGRCRDGLRAADEARMHQPAHVPKLQRDTAAGRVHRRRDRLPALDLRIGPDARRAREAAALAADARGLADDQASAGALCVVVRHERRRHMVARGAAPRQRCHEDAVGCRDAADANRVEQ